MPQAVADADLAGERVATAAAAAHAAQIRRDELFRDQGKRRVALQREARPLGGIGAAGAAGLAVDGGKRGAGLWAWARTSKR